jgi:hypothetical protein
MLARQGDSAAHVPSEVSRFGMGIFSLSHQAISSFDRLRLCDAAHLTGLHLCAMRHIGPMHVCLFRSQL